MLQIKQINPILHRCLPTRILYHVCFTHTRTRRHVVDSAKRWGRSFQMTPPRCIGRRTPVPGQFLTARPRGISLSKLDAVDAEGADTQGSQASQVTGGRGADQGFILEVSTFLCNLATLTPTVMILVRFQFPLPHGCRSLPIFCHAKYTVRHSPVFPRVSSP